MASDGSRTVDVDIQVEGLKDLVRSLQKADKRYRAAFVDANLKAASLVVTAAKARANREGKLAAKAARSLRAGKSANAAYVSYGGRKYPFAMGAEFGALRDKPRSVETGTRKGWNQFQQHRGREGIFIYPSLRENREEVLQVYLAEVDKILDMTFGE